MQRPSIACRRAVQSLAPPPPTHVWITDDVLSLAVHRFLRASCPHQRRHGSHVPGPLEASRRANKRRMAIQTGMHPPGPMLPPIFNFGALFGVRRNQEQNWRYEPPSQKFVEPLTLPSDSLVPAPDANPPPSIPTLPVTPTIPAGFFGPVTARGVFPDNELGKGSLAPAESLFSMSGGERRAYVKSCFGKFANELLVTELLPEDERLPALLEAYRNHHPKIPDAGRYSMLMHLLMVQRKSAGWTDHHILACFNAPCARLPHVYTENGMQMLRKLDKMLGATSECIPGLHQLYRKCASQAAESVCNRGDAHQEAVLRLLIRGLWDTSSMGHVSNSIQQSEQGTPVSDKHLLQALSMRLCDSRLRDYICAIFLRPRQAPDRILSLVDLCTSNPDLKHLGVNVLELIPRRLLDAWKARLYMRLAESKENLSGSFSGRGRLATWLGMLRMLDGKATNASVSDLASQTLTSLLKEHRHSGTPPRLIVIALVHALTSHKSIAGADLDRLLSLISSYGSLPQQQATDISFEELLARLMSGLYKESIPNHGVLELMLPLLDIGLIPMPQLSDHLSSMLDLNDDLIMMLDVLTRLYNNGIRVSRSPVLEDYLAQLMHQAQQRNQWSELSEKHTALAQRTCQHILRLLTVLCTRNFVHLSRRARRLGHILEQAQAAHIVPLAYRNLTTNLPLVAQAGLLEQFAHQYSLDRTRTNRQNWRSIYYLYKYMQVYRLKMTPVFTKAVLRVGIVQPLSENQFVSSRRLVWVCELVARVEGVEAAQNIERMFWDWRGNLIQHAKKKYEMAGGQGRVHISEVKRLRMI